MNDREKALAEAVMALASARKALYAVGRAYDDAAGAKLVVGELARPSAIDAIIYGMHEGEIDAYARIIEGMMRHLRSLRKTERHRSI